MKKVKKLLLFLLPALALVLVACGQTGLEGEQTGENGSTEEVATEDMIIGL